MWYKISVHWTQAGVNSDWYDCASEEDAYELAEALAESLSNGTVAPDVGTAGLVGIGVIDVSRGTLNDKRRGK